jgi:hypothetical protein
VPEGVNVVKNLATKCKRNEGAECGCGDVAKEGKVVRKGN